MYNNVLHIQKVFYVNVVLLIHLGISHFLCRCIYLFQIYGFVAL